MSQATQIHPGAFARKADEFLAHLLEFQLFLENAGIAFGAEEIIPGMHAACGHHNELQKAVEAAARRGRDGTFAAEAERKIGPACRETAASIVSIYDRLAEMRGELVGQEKHHEKVIKPLLGDIDVIIAEHRDLRAEADHVMSLPAANTGLPNAATEHAEDGRSSRFKQTSGYIQDALTRTMNRIHPGRGQRQK